MSRTGNRYVLLASVYSVKPISILCLYNPTYSRKQTDAGNDMKFRFFFLKHLGVYQWQRESYGILFFPHNEEYGFSVKKWKKNFITWCQTLGALIFNQPRSILSYIVYFLTCILSDNLGSTRIYQKSMFRLIKGAWEKTQSTFQLYP